MSEESSARFGAASGIVAAVLIVVGFLVLVPKPPAIDASAIEWGRYYVDHQDAIRAGFTVVAVSAFFFLWFLGTLRGALASAEGGTGRLSSVAFGGGLVAAAILLLGVAAGEAAAFRPTEVDPTITRAISDIFVVTAAPGTAALAAFFAATAVVGFRHGALPRWVAIVAAVAALCQLPALGSGVTTTGAFAGDGVLGLVIPVLTFVVGLLCVGIALVRNPAPGKG